MTSTRGSERYSPSHSEHLHTRQLKVFIIALNKIQRYIGILSILLSRTFHQFNFLLNSLPQPPKINKHSTIKQNYAVILSHIPLKSLVDACLLASHLIASIDLLISEANCYLQFISPNKHVHTVINNNKLFASHNSKGNTSSALCNFRNWKLRRDAISISDVVKGEV
jgi:hypothetical protein